MSIENDKKKLLTLLSQLNEHTIKINTIVKEINDLSLTIKTPNLNLDPDLIQLKIIVDSLISKIKNYYDQLKLNEIRIKASKNIESHKPNEIMALPDSNSKDLKILIGFKNASGVAYTFEAKYGTTIDKLISTYLKTIGKNIYQNDLIFEYNGDSLYVGDYRKIETIFCNAQEPTIIVKKNEYFPTMVNNNVIGINDLATLNTTTTTNNNGVYEFTSLADI